MWRAQVERQKGQATVPAFSAGRHSTPGATLRGAVLARGESRALCPDHEGASVKTQTGKCSCQRWTSPLLLSVLTAFPVAVPCPCTVALLLPLPHPRTCRASGAVSGSWAPFRELFHLVASITNNSGTNKRTLECSADGRCHTGKINPQICSLMESSCRQMLSCEAASSQTDYFLAHVVYRRATPGISSFVQQHFSKHI